MGKRILTVYPGDDIQAALETGRPLRFLAGVYPCDASVLHLPEGARLSGAGIGQTEIMAAMDFGTDTRADGLTIGKRSNGRPSYIRAGSESVFFDGVRFRAPGRNIVFDACDYTGWSEPVRRERCDFSYVVFGECEFEFSVSGCDIFSLWPDCRAGGGNVRDLSFYSCTFGARNAAGQYGPQHAGLLIQPSPPEHGNGGPRPGNTINYDFDWSIIDHGIGIPGQENIVLDDCDFVGECSLASLDLSDYMRSYIMTTARNPDGSPKYTSGTDGTPEERDACPDKVCAHGLRLYDVRFSDAYIPEIGRDCPDDSYPDHLHDDPPEYVVPDSVLAHDHELYGL